MTYLPAVRHAALEHQGSGSLALHLHFARPLGPTDKAIVFAGLGEYILNKNGPVLVPEFHGDIVLLRPVPEEGPLDDAGFKAAARHFGFESPDGDLPFIGHGQCLSDDTVEGDEPMIIAAAPLLRQ